MKRALIFLFVGPTVGFLLAIGSAMALGTAIGVDVNPWEPVVLGVIFVYSYTAGVIPAALTGLVDWRLATRTTFARRILQTAGAGFVTSALIGLILLNHRLSGGAILIFAIYGAIAAALCSWLSGRSPGLAEAQ